jgi:hypothetical protein
LTSKLSISCGVPQGAVLSPNLFSLYINDIPIDDKKNITFSLLFADDLAFIRTYHKHKKKVEEEINKHLKKIEKWLSVWRLTMATKKCQYLLSSGKNNLAKNKMDLKLFNENLLKDNVNF